MTHHLFDERGERLSALYRQGRRGRTKAEVDEIIFWLTGHDQKSLTGTERAPVSVFARAPRLNPSRSRITGVVCGVRVEEIEEPTMREIRYLDKLIDELAKGKAMEKICAPDRFRFCLDQPHTSSLPGPEPSMLQRSPWSRVR